MAFDHSEPKIGRIFDIGVFSLVFIAVVRFGLASYFNREFGDEYLRKVGAVKSQALESLRADEQKKLAGAQMPIERAMGLLAARPRAAVSEALNPKPSEDTAALVGWVERPRPLPTPPPAVAVAGDGGTAMQGDGGAAALSTDGGAAVSPSTDGGAVLQGAALTDAGAGMGAAKGSDAGVPPGSATTGKPGVGDGGAVRKP